MRTEYRPAAWSSREAWFAVSRDDYTVYVRPELVVEIAFNDLQRSPHYPGDLALRFARVKRYRPALPAGRSRRSVFSG